MAGRPQCGIVHVLLIAFILHTMEATLSYDVGTIEATLTLDRTPFNQAMRLAQRTAAAFSRREILPTLGMDSSSFDTSARSAGVTADSLDNRWIQMVLDLGGGVGVMREADRVKRYVENLNPEMKVSPDQAFLEAKMRETDRTVKRWTRNLSPTPIKIRAQVELERAFLQLRTLEKLRDDASGEARITAEAQVESARVRLEAIRDLARSVGAEDPTIGVTLFNARRVMSELLGIDMYARRLDGRTITMRANIDQSLASALPQMLGDTTQQIMRFQSVASALAAVSVPLMITKFAAMPAVLAGAATAAGGLVTQLVPGLVGALGSVTGALGLGAAALGGYGLAIARTWQFVGNFTQTLYDQYRAVDRAGSVATELKKSIEALPPGMISAAQESRLLAMAQQNVRQEQEKMVVMAGMVTPALQRLGNQVFDAQMQMLKLSGSIMNAVAPAMSYGITLFDRFGARIAAGATGMAADMTRVAISIMRTASRGQQLRSITTILSGIRAAGVPALSAVGNAAMAFLNVLQVIVPNSLKVLGAISRLAGAARSWTASAQGQATISRVWASMVVQGQKLWRIAQNLAVGLWGVIKALNASGVGQYLLSQMVLLSGQFANLMRDGGRAQAAISRFGGAVKPILGALGGLALAGAKAFLRLADEVVNMQNKATGNRVLVDIINAAKQAIGPLTDMLLRDFEAIAPLLPGLIKNLSEWAAIFVPATPEMILFIKALNGILGAFNQLDPNTRIMIARIFAWGSAINMLVGGALVSIIGSLGQYFLLMSIVGLVTGKNVGIVGALASAFSAVAAALGISSLALFGWLAVAAIVVAAMAVAAYQIMKHWDDLKKFFTGLPKWLQQGLIAGLKAVPLVGPFLAWIIPVIDRFRKYLGIGSPSKLFYGFGIAIVQGLINGIKSLMSNLYGILPAGIKRAIALVGNALRLGGNVIRGIFTGNWAPAIRSVRTYWNSLPSGVQAAARIIFAALRLAGNVIRGIFTGNWAPAIASARKLWTMLPSGVRGALTIIGNVLRLGGAIMRGIFSGQWGGAVRAAKALFDSLPAGIRTKLSVIGGILRTVGAVIMAVFRGNWGAAINGALSLFARLAPQTFAKLQLVVAVIRRVGSIVMAVFRGDWGSAVGLALSLFARFAPNVYRKILLVSNYVRVVGQIIRRIFQGDWNGAISLAVALFARLFPGVSKTLEKIGSTVRGWVDKIRSIFKGINLYDIGVSIIQGLINGLWSMAGALWNAVKSIVGGAEKAGRKEAKSKSPSRVWEDFGIDLWRGGIRGMLRGVIPMRRAAERLTASALAGARGASLAFGVEANARAGLRGGYAPANAGVARAMPPTMGGETGSLARALGAKIDELMDENRRLSREQAGAAAKIAFLAQRSDLGKYIQDLNLIEMGQTEMAKLPRSR